MQVNRENIQRPSLITPFFNMELTPDNEYLTYIDTMNESKSVTSNHSNDNYNSLKENTHTYEDLSTFDDKYRVLTFSVKTKSGNYLHITSVISEITFHVVKEVETTNYSRSRENHSLAISLYLNKPQPLKDASSLV